jgi:hypothetical protein
LQTEASWRSSALQGLVSLRARATHELQDALAAVGEHLGGGGAHEAEPAPLHRTIQTVMAEEDVRVDAMVAVEASDADTF